MSPGRGIEVRGTSILSIVEPIPSLPGQEEREPFDKLRANDARVSVSCSGGLRRELAVTFPKLDLVDLAGA